MNNALSSNAYIAIHNNEIRLYADGRCRRIDDSGEERILRRSLVPVDSFSDADRATYLAWQAEGDALNRRLGIV